MTKSQSNQAFDAAKSTQASGAQNAQSSYDAATTGVGDYKTALAKYAAQNPFTQGGQYQTSTNQQMADTGAAGSVATGQAITGEMVRSGLNPTAGIAAAKQVALGNARTQMDEEAKANQARLQGDAGYNANVLSASAKPEEMDADLTKTELGGSNQALGDETETAKTPSFWSQAGMAVINGGAQVGAAFCPAEGSLYLMADGTEKPVEELKVGDELCGIDGDPETIEEIQTAIAPILLVRSDQGHRLRNSWSHAYALPVGGFTVAARSLGKSLVSEGSPARVVSVEPYGSARVFNVITNGSHTYRADGVWALGVGDAERNLSMEQWQKVSEQLMAEVL